MDFPPQGLLATSIAGGVVILGDLNPVTDATFVIGTVNKRWLDVRSVTMTLPNATGFLRWLDSGGSEQNVMVLDASDNFILSNPGGGTITIQTTDLAGDPSTRMSFSGGLDTAVMTLTNVTVTGLSLSGGIDFNGQNIDDVLNITLTDEGAIQTGTAAADFFTLDARDVDGAVFVTFITLTANNTPAITIGTTTASTQTFTGTWATSSLVLGAFQLSGNIDVNQMTLDNVLILRMESASSQGLFWNEGADTRIRILYDGSANALDINTANAAGGLIRRLRIGSESDTPTTTVSNMTWDFGGNSVLNVGDVGNDFSSSNSLVETTFSGSIFVIEAAAASDDVAGNGQFWVKSNTPNDPFFTDDTGVDREFTTGDFAGLLIVGNAVATTINIVQVFEHITVFDTDQPEIISNAAHATDNITVGESATYRVYFFAGATPAGTNKTYEIFAFELNTSGATIITDVTQATPGVVTAVAHGFSDGNRVKITGVVGMTELNGKIFTVTNKGDDTFELEDDNGTDIATGGFTAYDSGGTATLSTRLDQVHARRKFAAADLGSVSGGGIIALTKDKTLELFVKGITDATNITFESLSFIICRVGR